MSRRDAAAALGGPGHCAGSGGGADAPRSACPETDRSAASEHESAHAGARKRVGAVEGLEGLGSHPGSPSPRSSGSPEGDGSAGSDSAALGPSDASGGGSSPRTARSRAHTQRAGGPAPEPAAPPRRIAVAVSGGGRSLDNLARRAARMAPPIEIALVVADRPGIGAFGVAARHGLPILRLEPASFPDRAAWSAALFAAAEAAEAELLVLAGFLRQIRLPPAWHRRVLNIHPSLLPKYGGKGYYGERVHAAVLAAGESESGCSVHFVDDRYDEGPLLLQRRVPVLPGDDVARLAERVFAAEVEALPAAIELFFRSS